MNINSIIATIRIGLRDRFIKGYTHDLVKISRNRQTRWTYDELGKNAQPLTSEQKKEILEFWKPYKNVKKDLKWFAFYNATCHDKSKLKYYMPDSLYYSVIDTFFTNVRHSQVLDDKNLYDLYYHDVRMPKTVIRKIDGVLFDRDYQTITMEQAVQLCRQAGSVVTKLSQRSGGGKGLKFFDFDSVTDEEFKEWLVNSDDNIIIQEIVEQHEMLSDIHSNSINTLRIMSLFLDGQTQIVSSLLRTGRDGARVDNGSSGGIFCGINPDGTLKELAHDTMGNECTQHPQGTVFKGLKVVGYERCCELVRQLACRMFTTTKLISWDFAIGTDGEPILIEVNLTYGGLSTHQLSNGPVFGEKTEEILSRVYSKKSKKK